MLMLMCSDCGAVTNDPVHIYRQYPGGNGGEGRLVCAACFAAQYEAQSAPLVEGEPTYAAPATDVTVAAIKAVLTEKCGLVVAPDAPWMQKDGPTYVRFNVSLSAMNIEWLGATGTGGLGVIQPREYQEALEAAGFPTFQDGRHPGLLQVFVQRSPREQRENAAAGSGWARRQ